MPLDSISSDAFDGKYPEATIHPIFPQISMTLGVIEID